MVRRSSSGESPPTPEPLLTPAEVAALFRVDPKTVTRWAREGKIGYIKTLGGHHRFPQSAVQALLRARRTGFDEDEHGATA